MYMVSEEWVRRVEEVVARSIRECLENIKRGKEPCTIVLSDGRAFDIYAFERTSGGYLYLEKSGSAYERVRFEDGYIYELNGLLDEVFTVYHYRARRNADTKEVLKKELYEIIVVPYSAVVRIVF